MPVSLTTSAPIQTKHPHRSETPVRQEDHRAGASGAGALAGDPLITLVDTAFVGRIGTTELAALGVNAAIFGLAFFAFNFLAYGVTPLVSQALGRGDTEQAGRVIANGLVAALALG